MRLNFTAAHSSRVDKRSVRSPLLRRNASSPLVQSSRQRKPARPAQPGPATGADAAGGTRLPDYGLVKTLSASQTLDTIEQHITYIVNNMFDPIPPRPGMNSTRISEIYRYRATLPPVATTAHMHALTSTPTATDRAIACLERAGVVRKITLPGRRRSTSSTSVSSAASTAPTETLVLTAAWADLIAADVHLPPHVKQTYTALLQSSGPSRTLRSGEAFTPAEAVALLRAGFLTSSAQEEAVLQLQGTGSAAAAAPAAAAAATGTLASLLSAGARAASGSVAAGGGSNAVHEAGGGGGGRGVGGGGGGGAASGAEYAFAVPSMGAFLKVLEAGRAQLVALLARAPHREVPVYLLREWWDGAGVLPGKTKKWKMLYGLRFEWALAECLGAGVVELFDTRSVGHGVRLA